MRSIQIPGPAAIRMAEVMSGGVSERVEQNTSSRLADDDAELLRRVNERVRGVAN
jgi:hypothetical protein